MKKTLIALAAAASTAAFAQSNVTLYGRLDVGTAWDKVEMSVNGVEAGHVHVKDITGAQNKKTTSRLGVEGTEDLGKGLKAVFGMETGANPTDANSLFTGNTRKAYVGLSGSFGTVAYGTNYNALDDARGISPTIAGFAGGDWNSKSHDGGLLSNSQSLVDYDDSLAPGIGGRSRNAFWYKTPSFAGFSFNTTFVNSGNQSNTVASIADVKTRAYILGTEYKINGLTANVAYGNAKDHKNGVDVSNSKDLALSAAYSFGMFEPYALFEQSKNNFGTSNTVKSTSLEGGLKLHFGNIDPFISLGSTKVTAPYMSDIKASGVQIGSYYNLSKRTYFYGALGNETAEQAATEYKRRSYGFGIVHKF